MMDKDLDDIKSDVASIKTSIEYIKRAIDGLTPTVTTNTIDIRLLEKAIETQKNNLDIHIEEMKEEKNLRIRQYSMMFAIITVIFTVVNVAIKLAFGI